MRQCLFPLAAVALASCNAPNIPDNSVVENVLAIERPDPFDRDPAGLIEAYLQRFDDDDYEAIGRMFPRRGAPDVFDADAPLELEEYEVGEATMVRESGEVFAKVPVTLSYSRTMIGEIVTREGDIVLRRVDEVSEQTGDRRHWRFERAELSRSAR